MLLASHLLSHISTIYISTFCVLKVYPHSVCVYPLLRPHAPVEPVRIIPELALKLQNLLVNELSETCEKVLVILCHQCEFIRGRPPVGFCLDRSLVSETNVQTDIFLFCGSY